jgi:hypothetical protein
MVHAATGVLRKTEDREDRRLRRGGVSIESASPQRVDRRAINFGPMAERWRKVAKIFGGQNSPGGHLENAVADLKGVPLRRTVIMERCRWSLPRCSGEAHPPPAG